MQCYENNCISLQRRDAEPARQNTKRRGRLTRSQETISGKRVTRDAHMMGRQTEVNSSTPRWHVRLCCLRIPEASIRCLPPAFTNVCDRSALRQSWTRPGDAYPSTDRPLSSRCPPYPPRSSPRLRNEDTPPALPHPARHPRPLLRLPRRLRPTSLPTTTYPPEPTMHQARRRLP